MSSFILFGASGPAGTFVLPQLLARGAVHAVSRRAAPCASDSRVHWLTGDLFGAMAPLPEAQTIVSLGPLDAFAAWFERDAGAGVRRVLALSSMSAESKRHSPDAAERALAARLGAAEDRLARAAHARGVAWTIFRPTLIYGGGRDRSLAPIARFARRWRLLPVPLGARGLRQPVHAADLAAAVLAALDCAAAHGRIYPLGGGERLRFDEMLWRLRAAAPGFVLPVPLPPVALRVALRLRPRAAGAIAAAALDRLREDLLADNDDAARDFGYAPRPFIAADVLPSSDDGIAPR